MDVVNKELYIYLLQLQCNNQSLKSICVNEWCLCCKAHRPPY